MSNDELRSLIISGIDSALGAPWIVRRFFTAEYIRLLYSMRRYWLDDRGEQLTALSVLYEQEPHRAASTPTEGESEMATVSAKHQELAAKAAPVLGLDLQTVLLLIARHGGAFIELILQILDDLRQPVFTEDLKAGKPKTACSPELHAALCRSQCAAIHALCAAHCAMHVAGCLDDDHHPVPPA